MPRSARDLIGDLWTVDLAARTFRQHTNESIGRAVNPTWPPDKQGVAVCVKRTRDGSNYTVALEHVLQEISAEEKLAAGSPT